MSDIFFSYSREDLERIKPIVRALERKGYSLFWDRDIPVGKNWRKVIGNESKAARCVMVAWSKNSINSRFVTEEADFGSQHSSLVPLLLDPVEQPFGFGAIQAADFTGWDGSTESASFQKLYQDISANLGPPKPVQTEKTEETPELNPQSSTTLPDEPAPDKPETGTEKRTPGKRPLPYLLLFFLIASIVGITIVYMVNRPAATPSKKENPEVDKTDRKEPAIHVATAYPDLVKIKPGCFEMGSDKGEISERPPHKVCIKRPFYLGRFEVTFEQFDRFAKSADRKLPDDYGWGRGNRPVTDINWQEARDYSRWITKETGSRCRLPTEAEWEYAARAGTTTEYALPAPGGSNDIKDQGLANCVRCGSKWDDKQTAPVGSFKPNAWGLYDMQGNVWEWTADCWHDNYANSPTDGRAWEAENNGNCNIRVLRGGSWYYRTEDLRSADRNRYDPVARDDDVGFRLLCEGPLLSD